MIFFPHLFLFGGNTVNLHFFPRVFLPVCEVNNTLYCRWTIGGLTLMTVAIAVKWVCCVFLFLFCFSFLQTCFFCRSKNDKWTEVNTTGFQYKNEEQI